MAELAELGHSIAPHRDPLITPLFPALRSGHRLFPRLSTQKHKSKFKSKFLVIMPQTNNQRKCGGVFASHQRGRHHRQTGRTQAQSKEQPGQAAVGNCQRAMSGKRKAASLGLEPRMTESESGVLPLHYEALQAFRAAAE